MLTYEIEMTQELSDTFELALRIAGDDKNEVFKRLIKQYAAEVLRAITQQTVPDGRQADRSISETLKFPSKAYRRFPGWANKSHQINHQIIKSFFACAIDGVANRDEMYDVFMENNPERAPYFENNLNSMATDSGNSHGKCFDISGSTVRFTSEILPLAEQYKNFFK